MNNNSATATIQANANDIRTALKSGLNVYLVMWGGTETKAVADVRTRKGILEVKLAGTHRWSWIKPEWTLEARHEQAKESGTDA